MAANGAKSKEVRQGLWRAPLMVLLAGLVLLVAFAVSERAAVHGERGVRFFSDAALQDQQLTAALESEFDEFEAALRFTGATHPTSNSVFESFFLGEASQDPTFTDPGVVFIERTTQVSLSELEMREHDLGSPDFEIRSTNSEAFERHIVTRSGNDVTTMGEPLRGFDATDHMDELLFEVIDNENGVLFVVNSMPLLDALNFRSGQRPAGDMTAVIAGKVSDVNGGRLGTLLLVRPFEELVTSLIEVEEDLRVEIELLDSGDTIYESEAGADSGEQIWTSPLLVSGAGTDLTVRITATEDYASDINPNAWMTPVAYGAALLAIAVLATAVRSASRAKMIETGFQLEHARLMATTDPLTGLLNRAGLQNSFSRFSEGWPVALLFIDLDGFKQVNDTIGHDAGDEVLIRVAQAIRETVRKDEVVARIGGDEFVVLLEAIDTEQLRRVAERLNLALDFQDVNVSGSIGLATSMPGEVLSLDEMLSSADAAMYEAKRAGGRQVVFSDALEVST